MMLTTNTTKSTLNNNHELLLHDQIQHEYVQADNVEEDEKEFLFDKSIRPYEIQKKILKIKQQEAEKFFPRRHAEDRSFKGPWFQRLQFKDESGVVRNFRYTYWEDGQYVFNGKELRCYLDSEKVKVGDILSFWRHLREKDHHFITIRRRSTADKGGGSASSSVVQPSTGYDTIELGQGNEGISKPNSVGSMGSTTNETEGLVQQERVINTGLVPSFGVPDDHHARGSLLGQPEYSENISIIDSSVDDHQYVAAVDNSFTTSSITTVLPGPYNQNPSLYPFSPPKKADQERSFISMPISESFTRPFHNVNDDLEDLINIIDFDASKDFFQQNYGGRDFTNYNHFADELPPVPNHIEIMEPISNSYHTSPDSHEESFLLYYYKRYQIIDSGLEAQLKSRNCDPYTERLVIKYVGIVMKKIFHSTTSVEDVLAIDNSSEIEKYMQPLRDLHLNLPLLEDLVASAHKHNPSKQVRNEGVDHVAKKARASF